MTQTLPPVRPTRGRSTIAEIAAQAGVSAPTVSKVINGRADVSPETRLRVETIIREKGYERPRKATRSAALLEVIFHELESDWALEILTGVESVAREHDLAVVLSEMQGRYTPVPQLARRGARTPTGRDHRRPLRPE